MEEWIVAFWTALTYFASEIDFFGSASNSWATEYVEIPDLEYMDNGIYILQLPS